MTPQNARVKQSGSVGVPPAELARAMSRRTPRRIWPWAAVFVLVAGPTVFTSGQQGDRPANLDNSLHVPILRLGPLDSLQPQGLPDDWTHHRLIFSNPGTEEDAVREGRYYEWLRVVNDPRYLLQQLKRHAPVQGIAAEDLARMDEPTAAPDVAETEELSADESQDSFRPVKGHRPLRQPPRIHTDWSMGLDGANQTATITVGTVSGNVSSSSVLSIGSANLDASPPTAASATGTFHSTPSSGYVTITNGSNILTASIGTVSAQGTGTVTVIAPAPGGLNSGDDVVIGPTGSTITYTAQAAGSSCGSGPCFWWGGTSNTYAAQSLYAAITANPANCPSANEGGNWQHTCFNNITPTTGVNPYVSANWSGTTITLTNTYGSNLTFTTNDGTDISLSPSGTLPAFASYICTGSSPSFTGTFNGASTTTLAENLAGAIAACPAGLGVTASWTSGASFTVTAAAPGTGGNSIALGTSLTSSYFTWSGADMSGGADGTTNGSTFAYWSVNNYVLSTQLATNLATTINENTTLLGTGGVTASVSGSTINLTARDTGTTSITLGETSFPALTVVSFTGGLSATGAVQPNAYPAKFSTNTTTTASCTDFVVYPTGIAGSATSANIIAYNNLYATGCSGAVPSVLWAYNTGAYAVSTSPVLSWNGNEVAFIQSTSSASQLVVVKWASSPTYSISSPETLTSSSTITGCTAPCMTVTALSHPDTYSAPFYDYHDDAIYVGDNSGNLEKFTGVFSSAISGPTTLALGHTNPLASPVFDPSSGCVFVGDTAGYLYRVTSGYTGTATSPPCTSSSGFSVAATSEILGDGSANQGIFDGPLVDSAAAYVYAFVTSSVGISRTVTGSVSFHSTTFTVSSGTLTQADVGRGISGGGIPTGDTIAAVSSGALGTLTTQASSGHSGETITITSVTGGDNAVDQFATNFGSSAAPAIAQDLGAGGAGYNLYDGTFDNVYFVSSSQVGNLFAIGNTGATTGATLYRLSMPTSNVPGAAVSAASSLTPSGAYPWPSPLTEFCNESTLGTACGSSGGATTGGADYLFFSLNRGSGCSSSSAGTGCILSYNITTPTSVSRSGSGLNVVTPSSGNGCWASGGFVIDNTVPSGTLAGASQIYFLNLNGADAGGAAGNASSNCTSSATASIDATQASQSSP